MEECCGNCKYHRFDKDRQEWICANPQSDCEGEYTPYEESCDEHEGR